MSENREIEIVSHSSDHVEATEVREGKTAIRHFSISASFAPLPRPDDLARYEQILPGTADRILTMAEEEQKHRHATEIKELEARVKEEDNKTALIKMSINAKDGEVKIVGRGQVIFIALHFLLIAACCLCVVVGNQVFAGVFVFLFVGVYLYSSGIVGKEKKQKQEQETGDELETPLE